MGKRITRALTCVAALWLLGQEACASRAARTTVQHDEFTGETVLRTEAVMPPFGFTVRLLTTAEGSTTVGGLMSFTRQGDFGWQYLRCHGVDILADGQRVETGVSEHDGSVLRGRTVLETVTVPLDPAALRQVANSSSVRVRVCNDAWTLSRELMGGLHQIARHLTPLDVDARTEPPPHHRTESEPEPHAGAGSFSEPAGEDRRDFIGEVREAASRDHDCALARVSVDADHTSQQGRPAFWITACGAQRFYRLDSAGRFVDATPPPE